MKKNMCVASVALLFCVVFSSLAGPKNEISLVMVPREDGVVRVGMDIASRYPTLLLSYKVDANGAVSLHGWTGSEWVNVTMDAFKTGNFFRTGPDSALIIEEDGMSIPENLLPSEKWCDSVYKITTTEIRPLLHLVGKYYDFKHKDWLWFSDSYHFPVDAINPDGLNIAWYHKRLGEHLQPKQRKVVDDLIYWVAVRQPAAGSKSIQTETVEEFEPVEVEMQDLDDNPLTNDVPPAVVLGAGDAEEAAQAVETEQELMD